jgi:soluble lytic murein transglycosylase-like protein
MHAVIKCESSYNPNAVGDSGHSRGLAQIHRPSHPTITDAQAFDPDFAIEFMAKAMSQGDAWMWSCWKNIGRPSVV